MHGEIKLQRWLPFRAEQVMSWQQGMIWQATVWMNGLPIRGCDRWLNGEGRMQWKLLGLLPLVNASGSDVTRSTIGRVQAESVWLPSALCDPKVSWTATDNTHGCAHFTVQDQAANLMLSIDESGRLQSFQMLRWGQPEGEDFSLANFGGIVEEERTFEGYTIPTVLRVGWYFGSERFEPAGEFFRVQIDAATYR